MLLINNNLVEPYFNQALEEYLLNNFDDDIIFIWQNHNAVVIGKHQNTLAEINYSYVKSNDIKVVRRLSGGGTVFHDTGNVNFTFIKKYENQNPGIDFKKFINPVIAFLAQLGINAEFSGRNDILIEGKKVSGNAEHIFHRQKKILHHGTLLFSSNLQNLKFALNENSKNYTDKAVKSVRSKVANISSFINEKISVSEFKMKVFNFFINENYNGREYKLNLYDIEKIEKIAEEKYNNWQWNYGYSPKYSFEKETILNNKQFKIKLNTDKGIITSAECFSEFLSKSEIEIIEYLLIGTKHDCDSISIKIRNSKFLPSLINISEKEILESFF